MNSSVRTGRAFGRRLSACLVVAVGVGLVAPRAYAQSTGAAGVQTVSAMQGSAGGVGRDSPAVRPGGIQRSLDALRFDLAPRVLVSPFITVTQANASAEAQGRYRGRRRGRGDRAVAGLVLGAIGGLAAGGAIGVAVAEHSCACSDPAFHGFIIGAPIGAFVGGMLGYAIAR